MRVRACLRATERERERESGADALAGTKGGEARCAGEAHLQHAGEGLGGGLEVGLQALLDGARVVVAGGDGMQAAARGARVRKAKTTFVLEKRDIGGLKGSSHL